MRKIGGFIQRKKTGGALFLLLSIVFGLAAAGLVILAGMKIAPTVPVLQAAQDISPGDPIEGKVTIVKMPKAGLPNDYIDPNDPIVKRAVARHGLSQGDVIRQSHVLIAGQNDGGILSARLLALNDPSYKAIELPPDSAGGMLGGIKAGDKINVINVYEEENNGTKILKSETILRNATVIGVRAGGDNTAPSLVIAVKDSEAEAIALARERGKIYVTINPISAK
ncbi:MAG: Flp pilus assembly protein CpaB [Thermovenabulum sp.]|uniref:Flp pilus assembly protein CpaB n=1 Tax=Thermovenabulum sp. TaxID=3100335 RepID=UPI003C7B175A